MGKYCFFYTAEIQFLNIFDTNSVLERANCVARTVM